MTLSEQIQQRSDLIGTQVITRDTGKKLGVINQLWVDVDQREVVALGLRNTLITGEQRYMLLSSIRQIGDVLLVEDENALEDINILNYSTLIGNEVITETGELLGKVRGFKFEPNTGQLSDLVIASFGLPLIPAQLISTYELPIEEIVSSGAERLIVFEGAEERLNQLTVGLLERLGIGAPPWEHEEEDYTIPTATSTSNQLGSGIRTPAYTPPQRTTTPVQNTWEEDRWEEETVPVRRQQKAYAYEEQYRYQEEPVEPDNWGSEPVSYQEPSTYAPQSKYEDLTKDAWDDHEYEPPQVNIPERQKAREYEQETEY